MDAIAVTMFHSGLNAVSLQLSFSSVGKQRGIVDFCCLPLSGTASMEMLPQRVLTECVHQCVTAALLFGTQNLHSFLCDAFGVVHGGMLLLCLLLRDPVRATSANTM